MFIGGDDEPTAGRENRTFNGSIDEMTIYPFVLSAEDVAANFDKMDVTFVEEIIAAGGNAVYTVVDAQSGRIVKVAKGSAASGITSGLEKGLYILTIEGNGPKQTHKFIQK